MSTNLLTGKIEFAAFHQPKLPVGDYTIKIQQQVLIDEANVIWDGTGSAPDQAPSHEVNVSVAGPRFSLDPALIQAKFPPEKTLGEYYNVLPHIMFNRTTLAWERSLDETKPSEAEDPKPWLALLLIDKQDTPAPTVTTTTVGQLLQDYGASGTPSGKPEFIQNLKLEVGQHSNDKVQVIDVKKSLLYQIMPSETDVPLMAHVRIGNSANQLAEPSEPAEYPVVFCNRLPAMDSESTVYLISLENRIDLLKELDALTAAPTGAADTEVRFVTLASWSFATLQHNKSFTKWLAEASHGPLRIPENSNTTTEKYLSQGFVAVPHQTRQGNQMVSWTRSPLLPGAAPTPSVDLPVIASDQLTRFDTDLAMFDVTYASAWELGRMLTLSSKVAVSLFDWKRAHTLQLAAAKSTVMHLPFAPDGQQLPDFPQDVSQWFEDLMLLKRVPFHYLVPREAMLPGESIRFFQIDGAWLACLLDGAFSVGRVTSANLARDKLNQDNVPTPPLYSGFLLRSPVVSGWPHLQVDGYSTVVSSQDYIPDAEKCPLKRIDRLGKNILICIFEGEVKTVDIHEHIEALHFGVDIEVPTSPGQGGDPTIIADYCKQLRNPALGDPSGTYTFFSKTGWRRASSTTRTLDMTALAGVETITDSGQFGVAMIEGVEKVRFVLEGTVQPNDDFVSIEPPADPGGDDLTRIYGIDAETAELLKNSGIQTFHDLLYNPDRLYEVLNQANSLPTHLVQWLERIGDLGAVIDLWRLQAEIAAAGDWETLKAFQNKLREQFGL